MGTRYGDPEGDGRFLLNIRGDLLADRRGDEAADKELETAGVAGFMGDALIPLTCASFSGVLGAGASQISTSSELSASSCEKTFGSGWACWTETSGGTSFDGAVALLEVLPEDFASLRPGCVDFGPPPSLGVSTLVDCTGVVATEFEKDVEGVSWSATCLRRVSGADRFESGCSVTGALAFLFPRSLLESEGLFSVESF